MAKAIPFENQNSQTTSENPLPCFRDGANVVTCWTPTPAELQEIMRTGQIWLIVQGHVHPPGYVTGISPFEHTTH